MSNYTKDLVNLRGIKSAGLLNLVKKLNVSLSYSSPNPKESIMVYDEICTCDSGFLCEHRLQYIVDYFLNNP